MYAIRSYYGIVFGAVGNKTNFCTMGAVSDWVNMGDRNRLRAWFLAIGLAIGIPFLPGMPKSVH